MHTKTFTSNIFINTSAQKLWEALTSPELISQYWNGFTMRSEWQSGAPIALYKQDGSLNWKGKILAYDPYSLLSYTFDPSVDPNYTGETVSKVSWKLNSSMGVMMLSITHEGLSDGFEEHVSIGWPYFMSSIKSLLETGEPLPQLNMNNLHEP